MKTITPDLKLVAKFADPSASEHRPALAGVLVTDTHLVATDSFKLVRLARAGVGIDPAQFPLPEGFNATTNLKEPIILNADDLRHITFGKPTKKQPKWLTHAALGNQTDKHVSLATVNPKDMSTRQQTVSKITQDEFPVYESIIPVDEPMATITVNAQLLRECLEVFIDKGLNAVTLKIYGEHTPMVLVNREHKIINDNLGADRLAILMPMKF